MSEPIDALAGEFTSPRRVIELDAGWRTMALETDAPTPNGVEYSSFDDHAWATVSVPHNWDAYEAFRQVRHGDRHGTAWYRRTFAVDAHQHGQRIFLFFEGVGSYATVWVNGKIVGRHAGGLTTFTLDVTDAVTWTGSNLLVVRADHPAGIRDLPWVCGGCERAYGFSEGTQPMGIFRPVHVVATADLRIAPFGVHVWNDANITAESARVHVRTELKNYGDRPRQVVVVTRVRPARADARERADVTRAAGAVTLPAPIVSETRSTETLPPNASATIAHEPPAVAHPALWSPTSPNLYLLETLLLDEAGNELDRVVTPFGIRTIHWPEPGDAAGQFLVNGQPVFLNGICDYEHNLGASHAFTPQQIRARVHQMEAAGFNAFRDAHHPHNLRFQSYWDTDGLLWWTQFGAHVWFDNDAFRANFKALLRDWVKERRNSPSLVLWGLQNESVLPTAFAEECSAMIRELDPTTSGQRKITTCNGGTGTDWDVPQNWSGTYSGNLLGYADDLRRDKLYGEYGAWRSLGLHTEGEFQIKAPYSEERFATLLETKVKLAEVVRNLSAGHFMWLFTTHSNPGRNVGESGEQLADGFRPLDQVSPANNKGLFTIWGEPLDAYYMYRGNYARPATDPMVHIISHTWPDRWNSPGRKSGIVVYSNCDEVELFNDLGDRSLGRRVRGARGTHFQWDDVEVTTNVLYAEGRINGSIVARDLIELRHLPAAPRYTAARARESDPLAARAGRTYLYRVNCGGGDYIDHHGETWAADREADGAWGSSSWAAAFPNLPPRFGSQRKTYDPISGSQDDALFQSFRYGREQLKYEFPVAAGDYEVELYFAEPWYGELAWLRQQAGSTTETVEADCSGWRLFDVAINGVTCLRDVDLWREAGRGAAVKKIIPVHVSTQQIEITFPRVAAGQAVISAIAICRVGAGGRGSTPAPRSLVTLQSAPTGFRLCHALDTGDATYSDVSGDFTRLPPDLLEADWIQTASGLRATSRPDPLLRLQLSGDATLFVGHAAEPDSRPPWLADWELTSEQIETNAAPGAKFTVYRRPVRAGTTVALGANIAPGASALPMYVVAVVPRRPAPAPQRVRDVTAATSSTPPHASGNLRVGREIYADADVRISSLPGNLTDGDLIAPPRAGSPALRFTVTDHVEVWVAVDARGGARPAWLNDWIPTRDTVTTTSKEAPKFVLLRRHFLPDQRVEIGAAPALASGAPALPCFAIVRSVRPSVFLEAEDASIPPNSLGNDVPTASGRRSVTLASGPEQAIEWKVSVGVGDRYGLNFRYTALTGDKPVPGELSIIGADGRVLRIDKLEFPTVVKPGEWTYLRTRTGGSINAGTYRFRLTLQGDAPLIFDSLEVE